MKIVCIEPGIYRHFKGNLYFVFGVSWSRNDPTNPEKTTVSYHPLYPVENIGLRHDITPDEFMEYVDKPEFNYSGPRFVKIMNWDIPNCFPGRKFSLKNPFRFCVIVRVFEKVRHGNNKIVCVEYADEKNQKSFNVPLAGLYKHLK